MRAALIVVACALLCALAPVAMNHLATRMSGGGEAPVGSDERAGELVQRIAPSYRPWARPAWVPCAGEESVLFAVQAGLGGMVLGVGAIWVLSRRRARRSDV